MDDTEKRELMKFIKICSVVLRRGGVMCGGSGTDVEETGKDL